MDSESLWFVCVCVCRVGGYVQMGQGRVHASVVVYRHLHVCVHSCICELVSVSHHAADSLKALSRHSPAAL